jgi:hypothetical protein
MAFVGAIATAPINTAASGDTTIVAAQPGKRVFVFGYVLVASGAVTVQWKSGANALTGAMALAANGGLVVNGSPDTMMLQTNPGEALILTLGGAVQASGHVMYGVQR